MAEADKGINFTSVLTTAAGQTSYSATNELVDVTLQNASNPGLQLPLAVSGPLPDFLEAPFALFREANPKIMDESILRAAFSHFMDEMNSEGTWKDLHRRTTGLDRLKNGGGQGGVGL